MQINAKQLLLICLYFIAPVPLIYAFIHETFAAYKTPAHLMLSSLGLLAFVWFNFEFILMARPKWLDQTFGMDNVTIFHIRNSILLLIFSAIHTQLEELLEDVNGEEGIMTEIGGVALGLYGVLMVGGIVFMITTFLNKIPLYSKGKKLLEKILFVRYDLSKALHNVTILATIILYVHIMLASTTQHSILMQFLYTLYFGAALLYWIAHKILRPIRIQKNAYTVEENIQETRDIWTLKLRPKNNQIMQFRAGQYCYVTIDAPNFNKEPHPFSYSSSPHHQDYITITIKELGDYTKKIRNVPNGATVYLDGPYGILTLDRAIKSHDSTEIVMIAGGVGITPFLSQLDYLHKMNPQRKVTFIYGIRTPKDRIRPVEFEEYLKEMPNLRIYPVISDDKTWNGEVGFVDQPRLERLAPYRSENTAKIYFICGPPLMLQLVSKSLKQMQVPSHKVHLERFG